MASSAPNGSSMSSTSASCASARASATRWRMPPESSCGRFFANSVRLTSSRRSATRASSLLLGDLAELEGEVDVAGDGEPWEQRRLLEHQPGAPVDGCRPSRRPIEAGEDVEQRALPAARRAEQAHELALPDRERDLVERMDRVRGVAIDLAHVGERDGRFDDDPGGGGSHRGRGRDAGAGCPVAVVSVLRLAHR